MFDGRRWVVTAGPTYEPIDPVRFIGNFSSGKMGYALAAALAEQGADVQLISGPTCLQPPAGVERIAVMTAREMLNACQEAVEKARGLIMAAAVADFRPRTAAAQKVKKQPGQAVWTLELVPNPDILQALACRKRPDQIFIGFSLETHDGEHYALEKLRRKKLDAIVLNHPYEKGGIGADDNEVTVLYPDGGRHFISYRPKQEAARAIVAELARRFSSE